MSLPYQNASMMDTLCQTQFVDASLQSALQEVLHLQCQHVIELHAGFVQHTHANETTNKGIAFEKTLGILFIEGKKLTRRQILEDKY